MAHELWFENTVFQVHPEVVYHQKCPRSDTALLTLTENGRYQCCSFTSTEQTIDCEPAMTMLEERCPEHTIPYRWACVIPEW